MKQEKQRAFECWHITCWLGESSPETIGVGGAALGLAGWALAWAIRDLDLIPGSAIASLALGRPHNLPWALVPHLEWEDDASLPPRAVAFKFICECEVLRYSGMRGT